MTDPEPYAEAISEPAGSVYPEAAPEYNHNYTAYPEGEPEANPEGEPPALTLTDPSTVKIMSVVAGVMSCGIIVENLLLLLVIWRAWPKQNPTITYFILHLACSDLISGFQFLWFNCIDVHLRITHDGIWVLVLCGLWMVTIAASAGGIINFAHLRIHVMKNAMKNEKYSNRRAILTIIFSWLMPLAILFLPPIAGWNCIGASSKQISEGKSCSQVVFPFTKSYELLLVSLLFLAIAWLSILYTWIFVLVHKRLGAIGSMSSQARGKATERQLFFTMIIILSLFFVCHFPVGLVLVFDFMQTQQSAMLVDAFQIILTISFANALLNPFIYYWRMPATRDAFWLAFGRRERTQSKMQYSSATAASKQNDRLNTISIVDIENQKIGNKIRSTAI